MEKEIIKSCTQRNDEENDKDNDYDNDEHNDDDNDEDDDNDDDHNDDDNDNDNFKYSHFSSPHQLLPFQLRESMLSFFPCRFSAAVVLQHSAASSSASSLLRITASAVDTVAAFFSSENIFPVLENTVRM